MINSTYYLMGKLLAAVPHNPYIASGEIINREK